MHFCTAAIAVGGDTRNVMVRDQFNPISWPELDILRLLHGDESITDVVPFMRVNQQGRDERTRLANIYGEGPAQQCWGGRNAPAELEAPEVDLPKDVAWFNPLVGRIEGDLKVPAAPAVVTGKAETVGDMTKPPPKPKPDDEDEDEDEDEDVAAPRSDAGQDIVMQHENIKEPTPVKKRK
jgi:hypothetical protein